MIALGLILLIVGILVPQFAVLETIGIILLVVGAILWLLPLAGGPTVRGPIRGRWY